MKPVVWILMLFGFFGVSCQQEEEKSGCELYCDAMSDCYRLLDQPFSRSACIRDCEDSLERYISVGCRSRYYDLLECKTDLSCSDANEVSDVCASEIDSLTGCVEN